MSETKTTKTATKRGRPKKNPDNEGKAKIQAEAVVAVSEEKAPSNSDIPKNITAKDEKKPASKKAKGKKTSWSDERIPNKSESPIIHDRMKIEIQLTDKALGMAPSNPDALKYVATKDDEVDIYPEGETDKERMERTTTIWPVAKFIPGDVEGCWTLVNEFNNPTVPAEEAIELPYIYDYQIRGMFKDACGLLSRAKNNESSDLKAYKKWIDGNIFVYPRKIAFNLPETYMDDNGVEMPTRDANGRLQTKARPLRISGPKGETNAIAISEIIPPMSTIKLEIVFTSNVVRGAIEEWLDYGMFHGLGQWRNSGSGAFRWRELGDDWRPIEE